MRSIKVKVLARSPIDADYIRLLLSRGEGVSLCDNPFEAQAVVTDAELLSPAEVKAIKEIVRHGSLSQASKKACYSASTLKKHLRSVRRKLDVQTTLQAILLSCMLGFVNLKDVLQFTPQDLKKP